MWWRVLIIFSVLITSLFILSVLESKIRALDSLEGFDSTDDVYAQMDLINLSDEARRSLSRSYLIKKRIEVLNLLRNLTTKVPYNCYDEKDVGYDTSGCRVSRGQRQAEIDAFVKDAYVEYCKQHDDCKQASRNQYILAAWSKTCTDKSKDTLAQQNFIKSLLAKDNNAYVKLTDTALKASCTTGQSLTVTKGYEKTPLTDPVIVALTPVPLVISTDGKTLSTCGDLRLDRQNDYVTVKGTDTYVHKPSIGNGLTPPAVFQSLALTDDWLDNYWYFAGDKRIKADKDRIARCADALSKDDFVLKGQDAWQSQAQKTLDVTAEQIRGGPSNQQASVSDMIAEYKLKRTQQSYPAGWYTDWQKAFSARYVATQKTSSSRQQDMNRVKQDRVFVTYGKYQDLIKLANDDIADLSSKAQSFDSGQYSSYPACFKPEDETKNIDLKCCSLKANNSTYVSYCPESTSACAAVVKSGNTTSRVFRNCKDLFSNYINRNKYVSLLDTLKKDPKMKKVLDDIDTVQSNLTAVLADLTALEKVVDIVNADIAAIK